MLAEINEKLDAMQKDITEIKNKMKGISEPDLRIQNKILETIYKENANLGNIIAEQTVALKSTFSSIFQTPQYTKLFPIKTIRDLQEWENTINDENKPAMINAVNTLLGLPGLKKNLKFILCQELMLEVNLEGIHNKTRLKKFTKVMDVLFSASIVPDKPHDFQKDMRTALSAAKNRHHKDECVRKKKEILKSANTNDKNLNKFF